MHTVRTSLIAVSVWLVVCCSAEVSQAQSWVKVNGGAYVDAGEPLVEPGFPSASDHEQFSVESVRQPTGDVVYTFWSGAIGQVLARIRVVQGVAVWELWNGTGWSAAGNVVPTSMIHAIGNTSRSALFPNPDDPGGFFGVHFSGLRSGANQDWDAHPWPINIIMENNEIRVWNEVTGSDALWFSSLIQSWTGNLYSDLAFDPTSREGIVAGAFGGPDAQYKPQLTAARYDHVTGS